jgi:hypothetical protein
LSGIGGCRMKRSRGKVTEAEAQGILDTLLGQGFRLDKLETQPPRYQFTLDGQEKPAVVTLAQYHSRKATNTIMFGSWDFHPLDTITDAQWELVLRLWFDSGKAGTIEIPASDKSMAILESLHHYISGRNLEAREGEQEYDDFKDGAFVKRKNKRPDSEGEGELCYCFPTDQMFRFRHWLQTDFRYPVSDDEIGMALAKVGMRHGAAADSVWLQIHANPDSTKTVRKKARCLAIPVARLETYVSSDTGEVEVAAEQKELAIPEDL